MNVVALAKKYYPNLWDKERISALVSAGRLTAAEYQEITGEAYAPPARK